MTYDEAQAWKDNYDGMFARWAECDAERRTLKEALADAEMRLRLLREQVEETPVTEFDDLYRRAQEDAREIVTLMKMAEEQGLDDDAHIRGIVRQRMSTYIEPRQSWLLIEVLARAVADTFDNLADWSEHVVTALGGEDA
jgi:hypothetical protein